MGFFSGALQGSQMMLGRRLANMYRDERDAVADDRWERTHALNRDTTLSNLQTADQGRNFAAALQPHRVTAMELANRGTEQNIEQGAELHPHRVSGASLANALSGQMYTQQQQMFPLTKQLTQGQITQQGLTTDRMRADNTFMQEYRPGLVEAQRIGNEMNQIQLNHLDPMLGEQVKGMQMANTQSEELHPWNLVMSASRYGLSQAQLSRIQQMTPYEVQQLANINLLNARTTAEGQPQYKSPTFRAEHADMAQARGRGFADKIKDLKQRKGWFAPEMSEYQILEMIKNEGKAIRGNLGNAFRYTPDDIHRYASSFMTGMSDPEVIEQYNEMLQRLGKNPDGIMALENKMFNSFWQGVYGTPNPQLTPEQQKQVGEGVADDGWFNWGNLGWAGLGYTGAATLGGYLPGNYGRFFRATNPARIIPKAGRGAWRAGRLAPQKFATGARNLKIENLKVSARQKVTDLHSKAAYESALGGNPNPATLRALDDAIAEANRLGGL